MLSRRSWLLMTAMAISLILAPSTADPQQSGGPIIEPSQSEIILQTGQNFTLICKGNSPLRFRQQEIYEENTGNFVMKQNNITPPDGGVLDKNFKYSVALDLINVDRFAVGYYACYDDTINGSNLLTSYTILEEPKNTEHISYVYVYVNGSYLNAPMRTFVLANSSSSKFLIECKPTTPDVNVKLTMDFADIESDHYSYSAKLGFALDSDVLLETLTSIFICSFMRDDAFDFKEVIVHKHVEYQAPQPRITSENKYFLRGETFSVNCTVETQMNNPVVLTWKIPGPLYKVINESNEDSVTDDNPVLYNNYTIKNASEEDAGDYVCTSKNTFNNKTQTFTKVFLGNPKINLSTTTPRAYKMLNRVFRARIYVDAYPPAKVVLLKNNVPVPIDAKIKKFGLKRVNARNNVDEYLMTLQKLDVTDAGNYTIYAKNQYLEQNLVFDVTIPAPPKVNLGPTNPKKYLINQLAAIQCEVIGYPLPAVDWVLSTEHEERKLKDYQENRVVATYKLISLVTIPAIVSGNITCRAWNDEGKDQSTRQFLVYEMPNGFGIKEGSEAWFPQHQDGTLTCIASKYDFTNLTWVGPYGNNLPNVNYFENGLSYVAELRLEHINLDDAGEYTCTGWNDFNNSISVIESVNVTVAEIRPPEIWDTETQIAEVLPFYPVNFTCLSDAVPRPQIDWYKDGELVQNTSNIQIVTTYPNNTSAYSMVKIFSMNEEDVGDYECRATSLVDVETKTYSLVLKEKPTNKVMYLSVIGLIFFILLLLVVYLCWKIRKEKQFRKELAAAGLLYFKEGVTKSINPDLGISEQAELLPYDEKFEFPADKLILGKQLGAGAFGVVYKAEARGIINAEETTTVAVKMVKKTADNMYIKALASELKIMVHLGKHVNIVNLLGACTKNVGKRELSVIVEYCRFGNIHRYLQQHREVFVDTLNDNPEKTLGRVNKGYSSSSANSGAHSDYFGSSAHTQNTDHTFLNTGNTNRSGRKVSETGYVQPEWRSNYECDYSFDGRSPRPLFSRDLLCWAFQIARGMEYLASRKVLHGDLAARNILLADDNVIKICDFGLARSIYKNDEYQKKENSPLPVKWLAIECISDGIFSTQSDVWSFGIVLWELFSLAKTPYPNLSHDKVFPWLCAGNRLDKPAYADDKLYDIMRRCWEQKPTARPSFSQLQEILGSFLEENVRNHYVDLNDMYVSMNLNQQRDCEDYLAMVTAPDYRNLCTPSAHHYVNDSRSFFPPTPSQMEHDDEGYLQMSPAKQPRFSPRAQSTKFDFDERKLNPRVSDGSELTPMLTLNNLPRSGSESDHEESQNASLYLNMCPRIEEEADEVFELKQKKNKQASAVTNPTYTFPLADGKQINSNTYTNVNVPNGLVK